MNRFRRLRRRQSALKRRALTSLVPPALRALELPGDALPGQPRLLLEGRFLALIENVTGVLELTDTRVLLSLRGGRVAVEGQGLSLKDARPGSVRLTGAIRRLDLDGDLS